MESKSLHLPKMGSPAHFLKHAKRQWMQQCNRDQKARSGFKEWNGSEIDAGTFCGEARIKKTLNVLIAFAMKSFQHRLPYPFLS